MAFIGLFARSSRKGARSFRLLRMRFSTLPCLFDLWRTASQIPIWNAVRSEFQLVTHCVTNWGGCITASSRRSPPPRNRDAEGALSPSDARARTNAIAQVAEERPDMTDRRTILESRHLPSDGSPALPIRQTTSAESVSPDNRPTSLDESVICSLSTNELATCKWRNAFSFNSTIANGRKPHVPSTRSSKVSAANSPTGLRNAPRRKIVHDLSRSILARGRLRIRRHAGPPVPIVPFARFADEDALESASDYP